MGVCLRREMSISDIVFYSYSFRVSFGLISVVLGCSCEGVSEGVVEEETRLC